MSEKGFNPSFVVPLSMLQALPTLLQKPHMKFHDPHYRGMQKQMINMLRMPFRIAHQLTTTIPHF